MSNTDTALAETYAEKVGRIAAELLGVLRDVLGPERRLPEPLAAFARYGDHAVTVIDGAGPERVELTAHLTTDGAVRSYSARLTHGDRGAARALAGPVRIDCSEDPEESPTLTYVLPLVVRLECGAERLRAAQRALEAAGHSAEDAGGRLILREPRPWGAQAVATVELNPDNGALLVRGRDAGEVCKVLRKAGVF